MAAEGSRPAARPAASRGSGRSWARPAELRLPRGKSVRPRAAAPSLPTTTMASPGRAPVRPRGCFASPATKRVSVHPAARVTLPPTRTQSVRRARRGMPRALRAARGIAERGFGTPRAQRNQRGRAPAAARSERLTASALWPTSSGENGGIVKWTPSTTASVLRTSESPREGATTAQSSPGPLRTEGAEALERSSPNGARNASMRSSSETARIVRMLRPAASARRGQSPLRLYQLLDAADRHRHERRRLERRAGRLDGQDHGEDRALAGIAAHRDLASVRLDVALHDGKPEARAAVLAGGRRVRLEEGVEHLRLDVARSADAVVLDGNLEVSAADKRACAHRTAIGRHGADRDPAARRGDRHRVGEQVDDALAELVAVHHHALHGGGDFGRERQLLLEALRQDRLDRRLQDVVD